MNLPQAMDASSARVQAQSVGNDPLMPEEARERGQMEKRRQKRDTAQGARQLTAILEAMADGVVVFDQEGRVLHENPVAKELLSLDRRGEDFPRTIGEVGRPLNPRDERGQPLPEEQWPPVRALRGETLRGASALDVMLRTLDGREILVNESAAPVRDAQGRIMGSVVILRDVTERRRLERQTHEALSALLEMAEALVQAPQQLEATPTDRLVAPMPAAREAGGAQCSANQTVQRLVELAQRVLGGERLSLIALDPETGTQRPIATIRPSADEEQWWWASVPRSVCTTTWRPRSWPACKRTRSCSPTSPNRRPPLLRTGRPMGGASRWSPRCACVSS